MFKTKAYNFSNFFLKELFSQLYAHIKPTIDEHNYIQRIVKIN